MLPSQVGCRVLASLLIMRKTTVAANSTLLKCRLEFVLGNRFLRFSSGSLFSTLVFYYLCVFFLYPRDFFIYFVRTFSKRRVWSAVWHHSVANISFIYQRCRTCIKVVRALAFLTQTG